MSRFSVPLSTLVIGILTCVALPSATRGAEQPPAVESITVIGSHIRNRNATATAPITSLDREELFTQGSPTLLDMVLDLSFVQGADGEADRFQGGGGTGTGADRATVNIRGFGPSRSLVLINGRRTTWSPMPIGQDTQMLVDINALPAIALRQVDFLRDGAAATYGSDAIAGVMNFTTRGDFTGVETSINHKIIDGSDGDTEAGLIAGFDFGGGRGHIVSSLGLLRRNELELIHRDWAILPFPANPQGGWSSTGRPATFIPGRSRDVGADGIVDPNCAALGGEPTPANKRCRFQYTPFDNLVEKTKRWQWFTEASWELGDATTVRGEYLSGATEIPDWNTSPSFPPNFVIDPDRALRANNPALVDMALKYPELYGPWASCDDNNACGWDGDAWDEVGWVLGRSYGQDGPLRAEPIESTMERWVAGLEHEMTSGLNLSGSAAWSRAERTVTQADVMAYRDRRAVAGLGGHACEQRAPNEYNAEGQLEFSLDTLRRFAGQGDCLYWSPFSNGMHGAHPQVLAATLYDNPDFNPALDNRALFDYLLTPRTIMGDSSLLSVEGTISGAVPAWELSGGEAEFALGGQWRRETWRFGPEPGALNDGDVNPCSNGPGITDCGAAQRTGLFGFLPPNFHSEESRDIHSLFGELLLPLRENLESQLSLRYENYGGNTGASLDPKLAFRWEMSETVALRASAGTTFRGPTLNQTVAGNATNSLQYVAATGAFKSLITKGDPDLEPEQALTWGGGAQYRRGGLAANGELTLVMDYWSYRFSNPLVVEPFDQVLARACPANGCDPASPYYDRILFGGDARLANLQAIEVRVVNGPDIDTDGIDFSLSHRFDAGPGEAELKLDGTRIFNYRIEAWELSEAYDALGRLNYGTSLARTLTEWRVRAQANYAWRGFNLRYAARHINSYHNLRDSIRIASDTTHDLHLRWSPPDDTLALWLSVLNLADRDPPFAGEDLNYDAFTHKPLGRVIKVGVLYRF